MSISNSEFEALAKSVEDFESPLGEGTTVNTPIEEQEIPEFQEHYERAQADAIDVTPQNRKPGLHDLFKNEYLNTPSIHNQATRFPDTVKSGPVKVKLYNLKVAEDLDAYAQLCDGAYREIDPLYRILERKEHVVVTGDQFSVIYIVTYRPFIFKIFTGDNKEYGPRFTEKTN